jgi:hypothetical protein
MALVIFINREQFNALHAAAVRTLPKLERLKWAIEIAEYKKNRKAAKACAISLVAEAFRQEKFELVKIFATGYGLKRRDVKRAEAIAKKPVPQAKMTDDEVDELAENYINEESGFKERVRNEIDDMLGGAQE